MVARRVVLRGLAYRLFIALVLACIGAGLLLTAYDQPVGFWLGLIFTGLGAFLALRSAIVGGFALRGRMIISQRGRKKGQMRWGDEAWLVTKYDGDFTPFN